MRRLAALALSTAVLATGLSGTPAQADDSPVLSLATGVGAYVDRLSLAGGSASGVVYLRSHIDGSGYANSGAMYLDPGTGQAHELPRNGEPFTTTVDLAGPMMIQMVSSGDHEYRNLSTGIMGLVTLGQNQNYIGATTDGWLVGGSDSEGTDHVYAVNATTGDSTDLGSPPGFSASSMTTAVGDAAGALLVYYGQFGQQAQYVAYAHPGTFTALSVDSAAQWIECAGIAGDSAACLEHTTDGPVIARLPLSGAPAVRTTPDNPRLLVHGLALTAGYTGWLTADGHLATVPAVGGTPTIGPAANEISSNGSDFLFTAGGHYSDAELHATAFAGAADRTVAAAQYSPVAAGSLGLGPGRVAWTDDSTTAEPALSRTLTGAGADLAAGSAQLLAAGSAGYGVSVSGRRTAFEAADPEHGGSPVLTVATGSTTAAIGTDIVLENEQEPAVLSGTRLLYQSATGWRLRDLRASGAATVVPYLATALSATLWGDYIAWIQPDGSVWRRDLTAAAAVQLTAGTTQSATHVSGYIYAAGDYVAWRWYSSLCPTDQMGCTLTSHHGYRNAATTAPAVTLPADVAPVALTTNGIVLATAAGMGGNTYAIRNLATGATTAIPAIDVYAANVQVTSGAVAWTTESGVPSVAAVPAATAGAPRFLGNPISTVTESGSSWSWAGDMVASEPLTSCAVQITSGTTVVRTLTCDAAAASQGDAVVSWNGTNAAGEAVASGTYTWTLHAGGTNGALRNSNGSTTAVTGQFTRSAGARPALAPKITRQPVSRTVTSGATVTFTATASGTPTPTVQWQMSTDGGRSWSAMAKQYSGTLSVKTSRSQRGYRYRAIFTNSAGSATTSAAVLTVR